MARFSTMIALPLSGDARRRRRKDFDAAGVPHVNRTHLVTRAISRAYPVGIGGK
jgi:hypothetical protein